MTVVNLRLGGQGEDCAQVMSHQAPFALNPSLYFLFSSEGRVGQAPGGLSHSPLAYFSMTCMG